MKDQFVLSNMLLLKKLSKKYKPQRPVYTSKDNHKKTRHYFVHMKAYLYISFVEYILIEKKDVILPFIQNNMTTFYSDRVFLQQ